MVKFACRLFGAAGGHLLVELPPECHTCPHLQFSLLSEVRGTISPQDLERFDHLVLRREIESMKARQPPGPGTGDTYSMVSYSDTGSSTGSHGTSTTVSSARVSAPAPAPGSMASRGVKIQLALRTHGFHILDSTDRGLKIIWKKKSILENSKKQNLNLPCATHFAEATPML